MGGALLVQFLRKTNGSDGLDDDDDDNDDDFDLETNAAAPDGSSGAAAAVAPPKFGVPSFNWGGHDNGLKMKAGEV